MKGRRTPITKEGFGNIPSYIEVEGAAFDVANSAAEEDYYTVTIPRNSLGLTDRVIRLELDYIALNNSGAARTITWRVYYGAAGALQLPPDTWANNGSPRAGRFVVWLSCKGDPDTQQIFAYHEAEKHIMGAAIENQDSRKDQDLKVTIQFSAASIWLYNTRQVALTTQMAP